MKTIIGILLFCFISLKGFGIDIVDIFYLIPSDIELERKKELVNFYNKETSKIEESERCPADCKDMINVIDKLNGFLSLIINCGDGRIEYCFWNNENGSIIIAVNKFGYATSKFTRSIDFYLLEENSNLTKLESENVIPYAEIRSELIKNDLNDRLMLEAKQIGLFKNEFIVFELPRYGKDIKVSFGLDDIKIWSDRLLKKLVCELKWNNFKLELK
jgi:hypothetical protein